MQSVTLSAAQPEAGLGFRVIVAGTLAFQIIACLFLALREGLRRRANETPN
jgi:hypothetical protein